MPSASSRFFRDADLVIFDAMYSLADAISVKADWGHSSNIVGVELCQMAEARHLCLFHHEPVFDDAAIDAVLAETRRLEEITRGGEPPARQRGLRRDGNRAVTPRAERRATAGWIDRIGLVGVALSLAFAALTWLQPAWADRLQSAWFDAYQSLAPRQVSVLPVTVVEIDQKSLAAHRPVAVAAHPAGAAGEHHQSGRRGGDRAQRPDARGRRVVARAAALRVDGAGPIGRRRAAKPALERCRAGRRARLGAERCWPSPGRPSRRGRRCARRPITVQAQAEPPATPPSWPSSATPGR